MYSRFFSLVFLIGSLGGFLGSLSLAEAGIPCHGLTGLQEQYCHALKAFELENTCAGLPQASPSLALCQGLEMWVTYGACTHSQQLLGSSADAPAICSAIDRGAHHLLCVGGERGENWCHFGRYIREDHPELADRAEKAALKRDLAPVIDTWLKGQDPSLGKLKGKIENLSVKLGKLFFNLNPHQTGPTYQADYIQFVGPLVKVLELHQERLRAEAKLQGKYHPVGSQFGSDSLSAPIEVFPDGKIVVFLNQVQIGAERVSFKPLGEGTSKKVYLALNYDDAVSGDSSEASRNPFLAAGMLQPPRAESESKLEDKMKEAEEGLRIEVELHQLVSGQRGISQMIGLIEHPSVSDPGQVQLTTLQKYYPDDLFSILNRLVEGTRNRQKTTHFHGKAYARVVAGLAVDLLQGLNTIHKNNIFHKDMKPENILVDYDRSGTPRPHITDFGFSVLKDWVASGKQTDKASGSPGYVSPEYAREVFKESFETMSLNEMNEVWGLGMTFYFMDHYNESSFLNFLQSPFSVGRVAILKEYGGFPAMGITGFVEKPLPHTSQEVEYQMLNPDPKERPTLSELLERMLQVQAIEEAKPDPEFYFEPVTDGGIPKSPTLEFSRGDRGRFHVIRQSFEHGY